MAFVIPGVLERIDPTGDSLPLVFDSPHSGSEYPESFDYVCPYETLRQAEDTYVDELFDAAPGHGAVTLKALFPRTFIDANRAEDDIDADLLAGPWPGPVHPTEKSLLGMGLIRRFCRSGTLLYDRLLTIAELRERLDRYYRPYHAELAKIVAQLYAGFGAVWHLDCHSMPSTAGSAGRERVDFVLGDRDGTSCSPSFTKFVAERLREMGYSVRLNDPYKGVELVRRYSAPALGRHSLQIEISRRLYMNEETLERLPSFDETKRNVTRLIASLADFAEAMWQRKAAE